MSDNKVVFRTQGLTKTYQQGDVEVHALRGVDLELYDEEMVVLLGASGSGKSTLLNILGGLDVATSGVVEYCDMTLSQASDRELTRYRRDFVGFVFQFYNLIPSLTARENVAAVTEIARDPMSPEEALGLVGLSDRMDHFPAQLSGGEQQRVAIARAFITEPKLLFADEPSANLDTVNGHLVEDLLFELNQTANTTLVLVTHDPALAKRCQRTLEIKDGQLVETTAVKPKLAEVTSIERAKRDAK